jgi:hypothetical protein
MTTIITINHGPPAVTLPWSHINVNEWFLDNDGDICLKLSPNQLFTITDGPRPTSAIIQLCNTGPEWEPLRRIKSINMNVTYQDER